LWIFIQADFADFIEKHLDQLNESIWKSLLDYCYSHDYWIDQTVFESASQTFWKSWLWTANIATIESLIKSNKWSITTKNYHQTFDSENKR
jgi:hypothetical protein